SFRELLARAKSEIREMTTAEAADALAANPGTVVLDVREPDEYEQGALPNAVHLPRGHLESKIEGQIPSRETAIIVHCASGARAAAAHRRPSTWLRPAWAPSASSTWTWSTSRTSSARSCTTSTASATARSIRPRRR